LKLENWERQNADCIIAPCFLKYVKHRMTPTPGSMSYPGRTDLIFCLGPAGTDLNELLPYLFVPAIVGSSMSPSVRDAAFRPKHLP
jgi:hypothetical protein